MVSKKRQSSAPRYSDRVSWASAASRVLLVAAVIVCGLSVPPGVVFAKAPLGRQWPASQQVSMNDVDHSSYDRLLHKHVDRNGYVDYQAWKASSDDRAALREYLTSLSRASTRGGTTDARLAFWINAYNAVTIEGILQEYPTSSIRNHTAKLLGYNIWDDLPLTVGGQQFSLNQIEHKILRKMNEPRIHFAIVCASIGCPRLLNEAYTAKRVRDQLAANTRDFFSRSNNLKVDTPNRRLHISSILNWFGEDFGPSQSARLKYLMPYLPPAAQTLAADPGVSVSFIEYDWSLNDQAKNR